MHDQIVKVIPSLHRYAYALAGTESGATQLMRGTLKRLLDDVNLEVDHLADYGVEECRNVWLNAGQSAKSKTEYSFNRRRRSLTGIDHTQISRAMDELSGLERQCLAMLTVGNLSYSKIANMQAIPMSSVNEFVSQAREALVQRFFGSNRETFEGVSAHYSNGQLNAFLDNELPSLDSAKMRVALMVDASLTKRLEELVFVDTLIRSNFETIDDESILEPLVYVTEHLH